MYAQLLQFLEKNLLTCPIKAMWGVDCMGCGFQRGLLLLLRGEFWASFVMFPALIPLLGMFLFLIVHLRFEIKHGARILLYMFILVISIMFFHAIFKLLHT
jgi:hypothetical protein